MDQAPATASFWFLLVPVAWTGLLAWVLWRLPGWARSRELFGYTLPDDPALADRRDEVMAWYRRRTALAGLAWAVFAAIAARGGSLGLSYVALLGLGLHSVVLYVGARRRTRRLLPEALSPAPEEGAPPPDGAPLPAPPMPGGLVGQAGPYALLVATAAWLAATWGSLAERFPVHYDAAMRPDAWADKSPLTVLTPLVVGLVFLAGLHYGAVGMRTRGRPLATEGDVERLRLGLVAMLSAEYILAGLSALVAAIPHLQQTVGPEATLAILIVVPQLSSLVLVVWLLARSSRLPSVEADATDRMQDEYWKAGLVYYNPNDPAVWVEKRFGIGYTLNFARSGSWWFLIAVVVLPVVVILGLAALA